MYGKYLLPRACITNLLRSKLYFHFILFQYFGNFSCNKHLYFSTSLSKICEFTTVEEYDMIS